MNLQLQPGKTEYTEEEAARALGLSATQFRSLVMRYVPDEEETRHNLRVMRFRASDLLMLSMLEGSPSPSH